ncbi:Uncharacterized protein OBRU01_20042, partial [Operophtera brumata]
MGLLQYISIFLLISQTITEEIESMGDKTAKAFVEQKLVPDLLEEAPTNFVEVNPDTPLVGGVKHWLVGNIPGNDISKGLTLAPYLNPITPPGTGLHRYTFLVFCQPSLLKFNENICSIPGNDISKGLTLGSYLNPITPPRTGLHRYTFLVFCQPSLLKFTENIVTADTVRVYLGNELSVISVSPTPSVSWEADPNRYYTLVMVGVIKHWLVGNIPGNDVSKGLTLAFYLSPTPLPATGNHRYTFLVYYQPSLLKFNENIATSERLL